MLVQIILPPLRFPGIQAGLWRSTEKFLNYIIIEILVLIPGSCHHSGPSNQESSAPKNPPDFLSQFSAGIHELCTDPNLQISCICTDKLFGQFAKFSLNCPICILIKKGCPSLKNMIAPSNIYHKNWSTVSVSKYKTKFFFNKTGQHRDLEVFSCPSPGHPPCSDSPTQEERKIT